MVLFLWYLLIGLNPDCFLDRKWSVLEVLKKMLLAFFRCASATGKGEILLITINDCFLLQKKLVKISSHISCRSIDCNMKKAFFLLTFYAPKWCLGTLGVLLVASGFF